MPNRPWREKPHGQKRADRAAGSVRRGASVAGLVTLGINGERARIYVELLREMRGAALAAALHSPPAREPKIAQAHQYQCEAELVGLPAALRDKRQIFGSECRMAENFPLVRREAEQPRPRRPRPATAASPSRDPPLTSARGLLSRLASVDLPLMASSQGAGKPRATGEHEQTITGKQPLPRLGSASSARISTYRPAMRLARLSQLDGRTPPER